MTWNFTSSIWNPVGVVPAVPITTCMCHGGLVDAVPLAEAAIITQRVVLLPLLILGTFETASVVSAPARKLTGVILENRMVQPMNPIILVIAVTPPSAAKAHIPETFGVEVEVPVLTGAL